MADPVVTAELVADEFDPAERLRAFTNAFAGRSGAIATFTGLVRGENASGKPVARLHLDHHPVLTAQSLDQIAASAAGRFALDAVEVAHRCGTVAVGEPIVWVAVAARHRRAAFEAVDFLMDRLKTEAMFWKCEEGPAGATWIEPTADDHASRARWDAIA